MLDNNNLFYFNNKTSNKKFFIATIFHSFQASIFHHHPSADAKLFIQALNARLLEPKLLNSNLIFLGDYNLNISQYFCTQVAQNYLDMFLSHAIVPVITKPTRISNLFSTTIDNVITNCDTHHLIPGIIESDLTDHYPTFCIIQDTLKHKQPKNIHIDL